MKLKLKSYQFVWFISALQFAMFSAPFLKVVRGIENNYKLVFIIGIIGLCLINILCTILLVRITNRWLPGVLFLVNTVCLYFIETYGILIDQSMIHNVIQTNVQEAMELITPKLSVYILISVALSVIIFYLIEVEYQSFWREIRFKAINITLSILFVALVSILPNASVYTILQMNRLELQYSLIPINYISATLSLSRSVHKASLNTVNMQKIDVAQDARIFDDNKHKRNLVVIVVGEAARAQNFSLNGYERDTNAPIKYPVINFSNFFASGASTFFALPCMFSHNTRDDFKYHDAHKYSNILDILIKLKVNVTWVENNFGCKDVCSNVRLFNPAADSSSKGLCNDYGCYDEIMLRFIPQSVVNGQNNLIVLHQRGSHGPAYYLRVPDEFNKFTPGCNIKNLLKCTKEEIINSYDNTIYYTSDFLNKTIELLESYRSEFNTALVYVSDHGESLGENGIYLHGMPYFIAPKEQLHIPAIMWLSPEFINDNHVDMKCIIGKSGHKFSHDYLFHTVLKFFNVETSIYNNSLDLFDGCFNNENLSD